MYEYGKGVPKDLSTALELYRKASAGGDQDAMVGIKRAQSAIDAANGEAAAAERIRVAAEARRKQEAEAEARRRREEELAHEREKLELQRRRAEAEAAARKQREEAEAAERNRMAAEARRKQEAEAEARRRRDEDLAHEREKLELQRRRTELEHEAKAKELALLAERLKLEKELAELNIRTAPPPSPGTPGGLSPHGAYEILPADLERGKYLGSGAFGEVFEGLYQKHTRVAMKLVKMAGTPRLLERKRADFEQEMTVWGALPYHDNVQPLIGWCKEPFCMVTRFMANGTATDYLTTKRWDPATVADVLFQIAKGMNHLHSRPMPILHSDLKGANVLVDENGVAKVADFGLSKIRSGSTRQTMFVGGTPSYMAPEVWEGRRGRPSDVYAFGMTMWEFLSEGETPLEMEMLDEGLSPQMLGERIRTDPHFRPERPERCPEALWGLMRRCWDSDPGKRPTFGQVADELKAVIDRKDSALAV